MTVKQRTWRFASLLALMLAAGLTSAAQAGVIPWTYNAIFGPVRYPASNYQASYRYRTPRYVASYAPAYSYAPASYGYASSGYAPVSSGCSSCSSSYYAPASYAPSYGYDYGAGCGSCGPVATAPSCGSCDNSCGSSSGNCLSGGCPMTPATSNPAESNSGTNGFRPTKKEPESVRRTTPKDATKTYASPEKNNGTDDGLGSGGRSRGLRTDDEKGNSTEAFKPAPAEDESVIPKAKKAPAVDRLKNDFETPIESNQEGNGEAKLRWPQYKLNLDHKIAWRIEAPRTRVPFHAKAVTVRVARHVPGLDSDWTPVVAKTKSQQLVKN